MYIGPNTPHGTNKNPNRVLDFLTKVLPKAVSGLAKSALARRSGNETTRVYLTYSLHQLRVGISPLYALDPYDRSRNVL